MNSSTGHDSGQTPSATPASDDPRTLIERAWDGLVAAVHDRRHGFRTPVFCTADGQGPDARVVVLRRVDRERGLIIAHTDVRSPKAAQIAGSCRSVWVFYDAGSKLQARVRAETYLERDGAIADEQWASSPMSSRRCYLAPHAPGSASEGPDVNLPEDVRDCVPTEARTIAGRVNFGVLVAHMRAMDVLHLAHDGHLRAVARYGGQTACASVSWVAV